MLARLGTAFIFLGLLILTVFWMTLTIGQQSLTMLGLGAGLSFIGLMLRRRALAGRKPPASSRFQGYKKLRGGKKPEEKEG